jgi:uncharacterized protein YjbI with pentapeptide repeats
MANVRLDYPESIQYLQRMGCLGSDEAPPLLERAPSYGDERPQGLGFFKTFLADDSLAGLTIPRTFFGRSEVRAISFRSSDLSESCLCWNDFLDVDFTDAILAKCDLRASNYERVQFTRADLRNADLRRSRFFDCDFTDALLNGAKLDRGSQLLASLTKEQKVVIDYQPEGEDPPGG